MSNKFTFFWKGPISQWSKSPFMALDGLMYNCAEQYMMAQKAMLFKDQDTFKKIMATTDPKEQQSLGRSVKNFNQLIWDTYSTLIVSTGNLLKFSQNEKHRQALLDTGDTILVEASSKDCVWGVGLSEDDPAIQDMATWMGENRLGFILTWCKETIIDEIAHNTL